MLQGDVLPKRGAGRGTDEVRPGHIPPVSQAQTVLMSMPHVGLTIPVDGEASLPLLQVWKERGWGQPIHPRSGSTESSQAFQKSKLSLLSRCCTNVQLDWLTSAAYLHTCT